ncbi:MAG: flagellar hook assembly protein FlgD [Candidatus Sericytochromatia bacterium]
METNFRIQSITPKVPAALRSNELEEDPQGDFIKLMVAQMQNQDPEKPMDGTALISQMVQMNSAMAIQRMSYLSSENHAVSTAASLLGREVMLQDPKTGALVTGEVSTVDYSGDKPTVVVNGKPYPLDAVNRVDL